MPVLVTVKTYEVVPALPSLCVTSLIEKPGGASSFTIVPVPSALLIVAPIALLRCTVKVSFASNVVSPFTSTVIVLVVSLGPKVSVGAGPGVGLKLVATKLSIALPVVPNPQSELRYLIAAFPAAVIVLSELEILSTPSMKTFFI